MKRTIINSLLTIAILTGCGGGTDKDSSPTEAPAPNSAPVAVDDAGLAQNNNPVTLDVLANDSDDNSEQLSISSIVEAPNSGLVEIVDNMLVYTPPTDFAGIETLSYEVSDGELTATAKVSVNVNHTMTLVGKTTQSVANAVVSVSIGDELFETITDSIGDYALPITINDMSALLSIKAEGSDESNQANVELISVAGDTSELLHQLNENRQLTNNEINVTNVTHLSTATYLLAKDLNKGENISSSAQFNNLVNDISADELIQTAGFIKLLLDNDSFAIPDGDTLLSLLNADDPESTTATAIKDYLVNNNLIDENGEPIASYQQTLESAIAETLSDLSVVEQFNVEMLAGKSIINLYPAKQGWLQFMGDVIDFDSIDAGIVYTNKYSDLPGKRDFNWSIQQGKIALEISGFETASIIRSNYPFDNLVEYYGFAVSVQQELIAAVDAGLAGSYLQLIMKAGFKKQNITLLKSTDSSYQVAINGDYVYELELPADVDWSDAKPTVTVQKSINKVLVHEYESILSNMSQSEIIGDWAFYIDYSLRFYSQEIFDVFMADKFTLSASTATASISGKQFNVDLKQGILELSNNEETYLITPFKSLGNEYLAMTEKRVNGESEYLVVNKIAKFDNSYSNFTDNLATDLPKVQLSGLNSHIPAAWNGDKLNIDQVFGFQFSPDGTVNAVGGVSPGSDWDDVSNGVGYFDVWSYAQNWQVNNNIIHFSSDYGSWTKDRFQEVISSDENGKALIFERYKIGDDVNGDGIISEDEKGYLIFPRINVMKTGDLSLWEGEWKNTQDLGLLSESLTPQKMSQLEFQ